MHALTTPPKKAMISVELWRARIGLFNSKGYSAFLSSLFSSYIPFKFHRRRKRERNATQDPSTASQSSSRASINTNTDSSTQEEPLQTSKSPHSASIITSSAVSSLQQSLLSLFWSSFSQVRGLLSSCLLREALVRLVLLIVIISQSLITSGDVETNPGPLACE